MEKLDKVERILTDRVHGSSWIAVNSLIAARKLAKGGADALSLMKLIAGRRKEMLVLRNLGLLGIRLIEKGISGDEVFERLILEFRNSEEAFARNAKKALSGYQKFVAISNSEHIRLALSSLAPPRSVYVLESLPGGEGTSLRSSLVKLGHSATVVPDLAMAHVLEKADAAICGCDALYRNHFVNKLGTRPLSIVARSLGKPLFVCATMWKVEVRQHRDVRETSRVAPIYENINNSSALFITEDGIFGSDQVYDALATRLRRLFS